MGCWVVPASNVRNQEHLPQWAQSSQPGEMSWHPNLCNKMAWNSISLPLENPNSSLADKNDVGVKGSSQGIISGMPRESLFEQILGGM